MLIPGPWLRFEFKRGPKETTFAVSFGLFVMPFL